MKRFYLITVLAFSFLTTSCNFVQETLSDIIGQSSSLTKWEYYRPVELWRYDKGYKRWFKESRHVYKRTENGRVDYTVHRYDNDSDGVAGYSIYRNPKYGGDGKYSQFQYYYSDGTDTWYFNCTLMDW